MAKNNKPSVGNASISVLNDRKVIPLRQKKIQTCTSWQQKTEWFHRSKGIAIKRDSGKELSKNPYNLETILKASLFFLFVAHFRSVFSP